MYCCASAVTESRPRFIWILYNQYPCISTCGGGPGGFNGGGGPGGFNGGGGPGGFVVLGFCFEPPFLASNTSF